MDKTPVDMPPAPTGGGVDEGNEGDLEAQVGQEQEHESRVGAELERERRRQEKALLRLADDQELFDRMAALGFEGMLFNRFQERLIMYGLATLRAWLWTGEIFARAEKRTGWSPDRNEADLRRLRIDKALRESIANECIASAYKRYRRKALKERQWTSRGGASLQTYFVGALLYEFANTWRGFTDEVRSGRQEVEHHERTIERSGAFAPTAEDLLEEEEWDRLLGHLPVKLRPVVQLHLQEYTHAEIAEITGIAQSSKYPERVIEGRLYRWRTSERARHPAGGRTA